MIQTSRPADWIPAIGHAEAMRLTATENERLHTQLRGLTDEQWQAATDCRRWTVRDIAVHLIASAQAQANPIEFVRQVVAGRPLTARIGGEHWVDGLNEAQLRARTDWTAPTLPDRWERHSAAALKARRRMPAPVRALPVLPIGTGLGVHIGRQPIGYLFDMGFTRDVWMHRIDIARAAGLPPQLTAEHDGRIIEGIVAEWSRRHGQPYALILTGPAGGAFHTGGGEPQTVDAVEFARILSGRATGPGIPRYYPISVGLSSWSAQAVGGSGANADLLACVVTGSLLSVIPLIAAFILLQRFWQSGLSAGAVKE